MTTTITLFAVTSCLNGEIVMMFTSRYRAWKCSKALTESQPHAYGVTAMSYEE